MTRYDGSNSFPLGEAPVSSYFVHRPELLLCRPTQPEHTILPSCCRNSYTSRGEENHGTCSHAYGAFSTDT